MAKVLFIKREHLVENSVISGNVDSDKILPFIEIAQEIHIQSYLGTKLYDKLRNDITSNSLTADYTKILDDYIQPMLIHFAMSEYLPHSAYTIGNGGAYKHTPESSAPMEQSEIDYLSNKHRDIAEHYGRRFVDYMSFNNSKYPEYNSNNNDDIHPQKDAYYGGWNI
jgi:hypothetical protein